MKIFASAVAVVTVTGLFTAASTHAFCGFYVSGADATLYNAATMVVLMRDGRRTVLSMQNDYQGPPEDFALVVPVPQVLREENVKTLPREVFQRVDQLAAPRLVEYWERDPCAPLDSFGLGGLGLRGTGHGGGGTGEGTIGLGVVVEAEFSVGEYDVVVLSARDSSGLDTWLRTNDYNIPTGAESVLRPYVEAGTKFFVAKVAVDRVTFEDGKVVLSPLRFHYDHDELSLPVRLGLLNSAGQQDLIVHILARGKRYEAANYPNTFIPTNIRVDDAVRHDFGAFYDLLFRRTVATNPGSVVTEYAWDANTCDPCPVPALTPSEIATLGADVLSNRAGADDSSAGRLGLLGGFGGGGWVLTRLHYRYGREGLANDLVFREAEPVIGGRGMPNEAGELAERDAQRAPVNNFQGRYVILHRWEGPVACDEPQRGSWGGPPGQPAASIFGMQSPAMNPSVMQRAAGAPADVPRVSSVGLAVKEDIPTIGIRAGVVEPALPADPGPPRGVEMPAPPAPTEAPAPAQPETPPAPAAATAGDGSGCAGCAIGPGRAAATLAWILPVLVVLLARRRTA